MNWKEYSLENKTIADWLPWGGITHPNLVEDKDGAFFGIIQYEPLHTTGKLLLPEIREGWTLWTEHQHVENAKEDYFLVVCWNPHYNIGGNAANGWGRQDISKGNARNHFVKALALIKDRMFPYTDCRILEYQEIIDYMCFSISMGLEQIIMPDVPLYLDALLSQDLAIELPENAVHIEGKSVLVFSLPASLAAHQRGLIDKSLHHITYRHSRRLLVMGEKYAEKELKNYTSKWCSNRKSIKNLLLDSLLGKLNGYYTENYFLLIDPARETEIHTFLQEVLNLMEIPYLIESYNRKDIWWGSLPGIFYANLAPPQMGFDGLDEFLFHPYTEEGEEPRV